MKRILEIAVTTNKGKRSHNEDNFVCKSKLLHLYQENVTRKRKSSNPCVCAVCDGMGGLAEGRKTSYLASDYIRHIMKTKMKYYEKQRKSSNKGQFLPSWKEKMNQLILDLNTVIDQSSPSKRMVGTTLAMLYFAEDSILAANVGDSRIYTYLNSELKQISVDHNESNLMKKYHEKDEMCENRKHMLTQYIGISPKQFIIEPHIIELKYESMLFLMCSDGLTEQLKEEQIQTLLSTHYDKSSSQLSKLLVEEAVNLGTKDNVTAMIIKVK